MTLTYPIEPPGAIDAIRNGLELMVEKQAFNTPRLRKAMEEKTGDLELDYAIPVYIVGLSDIAESRDIKNIKQMGWRQPIKYKNEIIAHAMATLEQNGNSSFGGTNEGLIVDETTKAIDLAEKQNIIKGGEYEARLLVIPALYMTALWLSDKTGKNDYTIPFEPTRAPLIPYKLTPLNEFLVTLQKNAKSKLASNPTTNEMQAPG